MRAPHTSVMSEAFVSALAPTDGDIIVDGTFGAGGHSVLLLETANCTVYAIDRDPTAIAGGAALVKRYAPRLTLNAGKFGAMIDVLDRHNVHSVDAIGLDIGVSSMHLDQPERGFSFQSDGPLDMRMSNDGESAADLVNDMPEAALADLLYTYGEERQSRRIAKFIVAARTLKPVVRTLELAEIVIKAIGHKPGAKHPATQTFQALRIAVNHELDELKSALLAAEQLLKSGGRLAVISFHSLEDRLVKNFLRNRSGGDPSVSRHVPDMQGARAPVFSHIAKPRRASPEELAVNPRARSAILRSAIRTATPTPLTLSWEII